MHRIFKNGLRVLAALALMIPAISAQAQPVPMEIAEDATWEHRWTEFTLPPALGDWKRSSIHEFEENDVDVAGTYNQDATRSWATVSIYRPGLNDISIWHDRAVLQILGNDAWTGVESERMSTRFFTPTNGAGENSAVVSVMPVGGQLSATGVALIPHGEWTIKIRMSSGVLDPAMIDAALAEMIDRLQIGKSDRTYSPVYLIQPCEKALTTRTAKRVESSAANALLSAITSMTIEENAEEARTETGTDHVNAPVYCRDQTGDRMWSAYQSGGKLDRYIVAVVDSGIALAVGRDSLGELLDDKQERYGVAMLDKTRTLHFQPFAKLPGPEQAVSVAMRERPVSSLSRPLGEGAEEDTAITLTPE